MTRLTRDFFSRPTLEVAQALLGKTLHFGSHKGMITETEAYIGQDDPACHAARGKTKRTEVMFGAAGYSYIYLIYGMYHCMNIVTEHEGFPAAVLIRAVYIPSDPPLHLDGPGKLCRHMGITREYNHIDMTQSDYFYVEYSDTSPKFNATPRIGIRQGKELLWRFVVS